MKSRGIKSNGKPVFPPMVEQQRKEYWDKLKEGEAFESEIKRIRKSKSYDQVKLIQGHMVRSTVQQSEDKGIDVAALLKYLLADDIPKGVKIDEDFVRKLMYIICPTTNEDGTKVTLSGMDTKQASSLFKRFIAIMAPAGIYIEEPPDLT
jgi:hypothetical protein